MFATRATAWRLLAAARAGGLTQQAVKADRRRMLAAGVQAYHQGGSSEPAAGRRGTVRPSKTAAKQEAKEFLGIARQLAKLTDKQLARLEPIVGEEVVTAVSLAASISHRNQGRQRQEGLVARLLRESVVEEAEMTQLRAALDSVKTGQGVIANPAVEQRLELWLHALMAGEAEAATEVFGLAQEQGADLQQLRQLLRQAQQTEPVPAAPAAEDEGGDGVAAAVPAGGSNGAAAVRSTAKARSARRQLRKLLQPLAEVQLAAADSDEDDE